MVVEPSGAVSLAAILSKKFDVKNKVLGVMISGGNVDLDQFFTLLKKQIT